MRLPYKLIRRRHGYHYVPDIYGRAHRKLRDVREDPTFRAAADAVVQAEPRRTLLYYDRLFTLYQALLNVNEFEPLRIVEVGVFKGGGSYFLARLVQAMALQEVELVAIDTFEGHAAADLPGGSEAVHTPGLFNEARYEDVREYLSCFPFVRVVKGRVQDVTDAISQEGYGLVHLDVDIHHPMLFGLRHFGPRMARGGIIVVDDHGFTTCPGVRIAVEEFLAETDREWTRMELMTGQLLLVAR